MSLDGRTVVVTGASKGIGRGVAHELAQHGARVFITSRSAPDPGRLDPRVTAIRCDHRIDEEGDAAFARILEEAGAIDVLVNSVWGGYERMIVDGQFTWGKPFWEQPLWRWDSMFGPGVRALLPCQPACRALDDRAQARAHREHLTLGRAETHRQRRLRRLESRNRQADRLTWRTSSRRMALPSCRSTQGWCAPRR
jgi:NAD(P)-dependent dehydrogenase (short-subunit alcohol dehydrogenase family)